MLRRFSVLLVGMTFLIGSSAAAQEGLGTKISVIPGMRYSEVLEIWGVPEEKTEMEAKHMDVWHYADQVVYFREGRVIKTVDRLSLTATKGQEPVAAPSARPRSPRTNDAQMEKILSEIMGSANR